MDRTASAEALTRRKGMKDFRVCNRFFLDTLWAQNYTFVSCFNELRSDWENRQTASARTPLHKANKAKALKGKSNRQTQ
jgi:hypothetical protein